MLKKYHVSKNLFDISVVQTEGTRNYYLAEDGTETSGVGWYITQYIPVSGENITISGPAGINPSICAYDENKQYLRGKRYNGSNATISIQGARYVRFSLVPTSEPHQKAMLNYGTTALPYEPYGNTWHDIPYYQHKTATDTLSLPAVIYPNASSITVGVKSGTPTPQNPVDVNGTGERTANLFDKNAVVTGNILSDGTIGTNQSFRTSDYIPVTPNTNYAASYLVIAYRGRAVAFYQNDKTFISAAQNIAESEDGTASFTFTTPNNCYFMRIATYITPTNHIDELMCNLGSTAKPHEPFGYKIPISMGGTTTPVYLGEVQTVRQIKKLVLTGEEAIDTVNVNGVDIFRVPINYTRDKIQEAANLSMMCNAYPIATNRGTCASTNNTMSTFNATNDLRIVIHNDTYTTADDFKAYLQQLYSANTPVIVWYVLATPQTAVVNELLMKIGTYADSLTTSIPCTAGENTLDVQTTVQPSEVTVNYKGWHPKTPKESNNGSWT